ncbi:MAG TPA: AAA family ATPase [Chthonomonadaceae bacterium]|nr:AAA family ATPase [Chthonomonadaceae bacterium]
MSIAKERGQIITFYSYKGGTGRSMALANVACLLADSGKRVLAVDWDLEAPGLHRFFCHQFKNRFPGSNLETILEGPAGLIEFFQVLKERTAIDTELTLESSARLFAEVRLEDYVLESDRPGLSLLKAGRFDETYASRVNAFRWDELYAQESNLFRFFAEELASRYDYVLIDSRTGLTDISGICTTLLPEKLVVVFTPNRQSLTGVLRLIHRATEYRRDSGDLRPLSVFPLASRIELGERALYEQWRYGDKERQGYQKDFESALKEVYGLKECLLQDYFDEVQIRHSPAFSYGEEIAVLKERGHDSFSLTRNYQNLTDRLISLHGPWEEPGADPVLQKSALTAPALSLEETAFLNWLQEVTTRAERWSETNRDNLLLRDDQRLLKDRDLEEALDWLVKRGAELGGDERVYLLASIAAREREGARDTQKRVDEEQGKVRVLRMRQYAGAGGSALLMLIVFALVVFRGQFERDNLNEQITLLKQQQASLTKERDDRQTQLTQVKTDLQTALTASNGAGGRILELTRQNHDLSRQVNTLNQQMSALSEQSNAAKTELAGLTQKSRAQAADMEQLRQQNQTLTDQNKLQANTIAEKEQELRSLKARSSKGAQ